MARKPMTAEEKKAWGAKMKAARAAKQQAQTVTENIESNPPKEIADQNDVSALLKRIEELEQRQFFGQPQPNNQPNQSTPVVTRQVVTKFSFKPQDYPDPRDRFFEEAKLKLKGFTKDWWDLDWRIERVNYEEDGQKYAAPRFELDLVRIMEDETTGEPSNQRYTVCRGMFFEDPDSFVAIANQHGLEVPEDLFKPFMDEMRYLTMRDWLLEAFYPPKPNQNKINKKELVIGNRLVEVFEINSEQSETMPFGQLKTKL